MKMVRELPNVHGNVWWPGWSLNRNPDGFTDSLTLKYQRYPALIPEYRNLDTIPPLPVSKLEFKRGKLTWIHPKSSDPMQSARFFAVYRFPEGVTPNICDSKYLVKISDKPEYITINEGNSKKRYIYIVTAIDRCWNESVPSKYLPIKH